MENIVLQRTPCQIYTRVMGYHRPVSSFNIGKKSEFYSRNYFKEKNENLDFINKYC
ncbi:hypothetical protein HUU51_00340 [Candidatus Gracilibacteria bacterium]|nr:anaerobic ribonucleoside-triphosphate reductase [Candidatus Gracilibacteria bacterium]NVP17156.1 hypothetical protein [Candidatus Gracilibacteria bacterium]